MSWWWCWSGCLSAPRLPAATSMPWARGGGRLHVRPRIDRARLAAFTLAGFFAGVGGLYLAIQTSSRQRRRSAGRGYTLNSIAAVVIGGTVADRRQRRRGRLAGRRAGHPRDLVQLPHLRRAAAAAAAVRGPGPAGRGLARRQPGLSRQQPPAAAGLTRMLKLGRRRPPDRDRQPVRPGDPGASARPTRLTTQGNRLPQPGLPAAAAPGRRVPGHRRRRHDAGHPAGPYRPLGALDPGRRRDDGHRRRRPAGVPVGLGIGLAVGLFNGIGVAYLRVPSMIFTLGINAVCAA